MKFRWLLMGVVMASVGGCKKSNAPSTEPVVVRPLNLREALINTVPLGNLVYDVNTRPIIRLRFTEPLRTASAATAITLTAASGEVVPVTTSFSNGDSTLVIQPAAGLQFLAKYQLKIASSIRSVSDGGFAGGLDRQFITQIDSTPKFSPLSDEALLTLVQQQTFKYFWDFAHPVSGLARERSNGDNNLVTSGGSGFGIMSLITGVHRGFITRQQGLERMQTITSFLKNTATTVMGAFPHWMNGTTGAIIPFSSRDNGADLVETSFLVQGLLCARQYFGGAGAAETTLRADINAIYSRVEWDWFRKNNEEVLYWHWSPTNTWDINLKIQGWNECLVTYLLAVSAPDHSVPASVYTKGWTAAGNNGFINGNTFYGYTLPLGPNAGGPLFFSHYSFLGTNPNGLADAYANYAVQNRNHTLINYNYCVSNPNRFYGYSDQCWGLTASDVPNGYTASSPTNDVGVIAPTAALASFPYTPVESMKALRFFYYTLGDKIWKDYGFVDAFALKDLWYANSFLAIDQGPIIVMIENYRSGLLWDLFTSCPEVKTGMKAMGFTAPYL